MKYVLLFIVLFSGCSVVGPSERGIRITLGSMSEAKSPGAYLWIPFIVRMAKMDMSVQKSEVQASAASQDMQEITTHVVVNWSIAPDKVVETFVRAGGDESEVFARFVAPATNEVFKSAISKRTAEGLLAKRLELKQEIDGLLRERLLPYGVNLSDVSIVNLTFSPEFTRAIEQKQIAEQRAQQAKYDAQKAIEDAKAEVNRAHGQAEAQRLQKETITPALLQKLAIDKWDGKFPQYMGGNSVPFLKLQ